MNVNQPTGSIHLPGFQKYHPKTTAERYENTQLRVLQSVPDAFRKHVVAFIGEFVGTFMFLFLAFAGTQVANTLPGGKVDGDTTASTLLYISLAFGFSLGVNAWVFFRITGGVFNPAVALGLCLVGALPWLRGLIIFVAQLVGAIASAAVVSALLPGSLQVQTTTNSSTSPARGLFIEMFLTAELVFTIFMLAVEKNKATFVAPIGVGLALFVAELAGVYYTGGSLNPARSFGPAVVTGSFSQVHWIYWVGPLLGTIVAVLFHKLVKGLEYESANPSQDSASKETFHNDEDTARNTVLNKSGAAGRGPGYGRGMSADSETA